MRRARRTIRDPRWCRSWRAGATLLLLGLAVYVPGFFALPTIDRDEARFAQASRQMFESVALPQEQRTEAHAGGLVVPMVQDRPRLNKPPLIYWLQSASAAAMTGGDPSRDAIWMYRIPSLMAALATVLMTWRLGLSMFDPRAAFLAGVMLALCPLFVWEARQARADHVLVACTTAAMWALWLMWRGAHKRATPRHAIGSANGPADGTAAHEPSRPAAPRSVARPRVSVPVAVTLWLAVALGILTKGPITPMVAALAALLLSALTRNWSWLRAARPILGLAIVVAAIAPWLAMLADRFGLANYLALAYDETIGRAGGAMEGHAGPPGYHLILLIVMFWPGSMLTGVGVCRAWARTIRGVRPWKWRAKAGARSRRAELFCLCWVLPSWIVFEVTATKLPHYVMPLFPPLALLTARTLLAASTGRAPVAFSVASRLIIYAWLGVTVALGVGVLAACLLLFDDSWGGVFNIALPVAILALITSAVLAFRTIQSVVRRKPAQSMRRAIAMAVVLWIVALGLVIPHTPSLWATRAVAGVLDRLDPAHARPLASTYPEDSVVFATRGRVHLMPSLDSLDEFLAAHPDALAIVRQRELESRPDLRPIAYIRGFNIGGFQRERLAIVEGPATTPPTRDDPHQADDPKPSDDSPSAQDGSP
ncbi:MAG: glycosyltransferase family 39 protein [Phycisphaerales bacterium]